MASQALANGGHRECEGPGTVVAGSHDSSGWVPGTSRTRVYFLLRADSASVEVLADSDCCKRQDV